MLSTDNEFFIKGSNKDHNIITYEKGAAIPEKMTISNITKNVLKGFGTKVGSFSNTATCLYAMASIFDKPETQDRHDQCMLRIKLLREIVGQEIDKIKGATPPHLPSSWKQYERLSPTDTEEERLNKFKHNSMVVSKKPYFFRYLYPELNQRFKQFEASYNQVSRDMFGIKFKKLLKKENKTPEEVDLVRKYQKYSPLITSNCTMNILCRSIESIDFGIKFAKAKPETGVYNHKSAQGKKKENISLLPTFEDVYGERFDPQKYSAVKKIYQQYVARRQVKRLNMIFDNIPTSSNSEDYQEIRSSVLSSIIEDLQKQLMESNIEPDELLFYCHRLAPTYSSFNWGFAWDILEDRIVHLIPFGKSYCPVEDDNGSFYLGKYYSLKDISNRTELSLQKLIDAIFSPDDFNANPEETDSMIENIIEIDISPEETEEAAAERVKSRTPKGGTK